MIFNLREKKDRALLQKKKIRFNFLVVGAGPAGIIFSNEIFKKRPGTKILLIDRSNFINQPSINIQKNHIKNISMNIKSESRYFAVGGSANLWVVSILILIKLR